MDVSKSDVLSVLKMNLRTLQRDIRTALPLVKDTMTKAHYEDVLDRIADALNPDKYTK